jgi:histidinol-phosphate aminotransferase
MEYERVSHRGEGLRLHLNENTGGCSPRVLEALRSVTAEQIAFYPEYEEVHREAAAYFGVSERSLVLTNGLDEGILATAVAHLRSGTSLESIVPVPAFDMYGVCTEAAGGRVVTIPPRPDFSFPLPEVLAAIGANTRIVFLASPNNPTGQIVSHADVRSIAGALPAEAVLFLDEAYADFAPAHFLDRLGSHENVLVGRTFAKAHGLAALRVGGVMGNAERIAVLRQIVPPYTLNVHAVVGLRAALQDREYLGWYVDQVVESKRLIYDFCARRALHYWPSAANFVLIRAGRRATAIVEQMADRRVFIRDRSGEPGCEGCIRITAGIVDHTIVGLTALEEVLCAAQ